jgi:hypothetical protein
VDVIDFDATSDTLYIADKTADLDQWLTRNPKGLGDLLVRSPEFHRHNVYALVMKTLSRFEFALGRRVNWGFPGHQLKIAPHAFSEANAFYSDQVNALLFGYFPGAGGKMVFTCLSHDVIVHETTHALIDGLRERYREASSADQGAFHEGFSDVVALLSVFSLPAVIEKTIDSTAGKKKLNTKLLTAKALRRSMIFGLAKQVGAELQATRGKPLRRSLELEPDPGYLDLEEYAEPHRRGEILVAAMLTAFVNMWSNRLRALIEERQQVDRSRAIEEGADIADCLLTSAIRALDYSPPVDIRFGDYLSALLTADREIRVDDTRYDLRNTVREAFASYGIKPASTDAEGYWLAAPANLDYSRTHFDSMQRDYDEVFHFIFENRDILKLHREGFTRVRSVRPVDRVGPDGFVLHETVCEYEQLLEPRASELAALGIQKPKDMPDDKPLKLYGGGALIFDEYGRLKFHIYNSLTGSRQQERLDFLWKSGALRTDTPPRLSVSRMHLRRGSSKRRHAVEEW